MHWESDDPQSGIQEFQWCIGTSPESCDVIPLASSRVERRATATGLSLPSATHVYVTVVAHNQAGLRTVGVSESFVGMYDDLFGMGDGGGCGVEEERGRGWGREEKAFLG